MVCWFGKHKWQITHSNDTYPYWCVKCGKRSKGVKTYRRKNKKIGIILAIVFVVAIGYFLTQPSSTLKLSSVPTPNFTQIQLPKISELPKIQIPASVPIRIPDIATITNEPQKLLQQITSPQQTTQDDSVQAINYINTIRVKNGETPIKFDQRAFNLGLARAKDMYDYGYLDHVNPNTHTCSYSIKSQFGFSQDEYLAENALGYETKQEITNSNGDYHQNIDSWMGDVGHKMDLLYYNHYAGAYACYGSQCVFEGVNHDQFVTGCHTAAEGEVSWSKMASCTDDQLKQYQELQQQLDAMKPKLEGMPSTATSQAQYDYYNGLVSQYNSLVNQINNFKC